jgi:molecular chaperone DnaK
VSAKDKGTGKEQKITITASSGLSKEEVDRMMREAESHADEDKARKEAIEARNQADQAVYAAERMMQEAGDKLSAEDRAPIESAVADVRKALESEDDAALKSAMEALTAVQHKAAEAMYKQASETPPPPPDPSSGASGGGAGSAPGCGDAAGGGEGEVIDAEVVEDKK